jgi:hypothetical protein
MLVVLAAAVLGSKLLAGLVGVVKAAGAAAAATERVKLATGRTEQGCSPT